MFSSLFFLKLLLVPALIGAITLAVRRWGVAAASILAGLPVVAGPILVLLALEQGTDYASSAALAAMTAVLANVAFSLGYSWAAVRLKPWASLLAGFAGFGVAAGLLKTVELSLYPALAVSLAGLWLALKAFPKDLDVVASTKRMKGELMLRMSIGAGLVIMVTGLADVSGPYVAGILSLFPGISSILAYFTHRSAGIGATIQLLKAIASGFYAFAVFCFIVSLTLPIWSSILSFVLAVAGAILVHSIVLLRGRILNRAQLHLVRN